jgi:tRNA1(Val) A37 N6-methylase TrmN6
MFETSSGYAWGQLPEGSLIVDVGGGVGSRSLALAKRHPHLRLVIQDREPVVQDAVEVNCILVPRKYDEFPTI